MGLPRRGARRVRPGLRVPGAARRAPCAVGFRRARPIGRLRGAGPPPLCFQGHPREERAIATRFATRRVHDPRSASARDDSVAVEEPLEIRVAGDAVAITMRTPGDDGDLALGFLYGESIISAADDVGAVAHCGRPGAEGYGNVIEVTAAAGVALAIERVEASRRGTLTTAACGVCGRRSIDDLMATCVRLAPGPVVAASAVAAAVAGLREAQGVFARTGGTHAAAAHDAAGGRLAVREDVGRHNAVDKIAGWMFKHRVPAHDKIFYTTGRLTSEMVIKAAQMRIPFLVSRSGLTQMGYEIAQKVGMTMIGRATNKHYLVFTGGDRFLP
jgi:FdhD protein